MSQFMLETEEDMLGYLDAKYGHGIDTVYIRNGTSSNIVIILDNEYVEQDLGVGVEFIWLSSLPPIIKITSELWIASFDGWYWWKSASPI